MHIAFRVVVPLVLTAALASTAFAQELSLKGVSRSIAIPAAHLKDMPRTRVTATIHNRRHRFEGVRLSVLLKEVYAPQGEALKGQALTNAVIVRAKDGYEVVLSLAETDPAMRREAIIVADTMDGRPLPAADGPLRLVVEGDLRAARSARMVESIEVRPLGSR